MNAAPRDIASILASASTVVEIPIAWGEMDALGHVNNVVFFRYMETARVAFIRELGWKDPRAGSGHLGQNGVGFILQSAQCRFRRPLVYPDTVRVTSRVATVSEDRFSLDHEVISSAQSAIAAIGQGTIVTYDYSISQKVNIPAALRARLSEFLNARGETQPGGPAAV